MRKKRIYLEGSPKSEPDSAFHRQPIEPFTIQKDLTGTRSNCAGQQVDQCTLASTVWTYQRVPGASSNFQVDRVGYPKRAECLAELLRLKRHLIHCCPYLHFENARQPRGLPRPTLLSQP